MKDKLKKLDNTLGYMLISICVCLWVYGIYVSDTIIDKLLSIIPLYAWYMCVDKFVKYYFI